MVYDNEEIVIEGDWIHCPNKEVKVYIPSLLLFIKTKVKTLVGHGTNNGVDCYAWMDDNYVHIGCLKEIKQDFNKKYIQLIKQINNARNTEKRQRAERQ